MRRLIRYLYPKFNDGNIIKRMCISNLVEDKVAKLDGIDIRLIAVRLFLPFVCPAAHEAQEIPSRISIVHDGWSTKRRRPFSSICIQYIHSDPDTPRIWTLKNQLLNFKRTIGRHTGILVGQELVDVVGKFGFVSKVSFRIFDLTIA